MQGWGCRNKIFQQQTCAFCVKTAAVLILLRGLGIKLCGAAWRDSQYSGSVSAGQAARHAGCIACTSRHAHDVASQGLVFGAILLLAGLVV